MLSIEQISKLKNGFIGVVNKYDLFPSEFVDKYIDKLASAPASTLLKLHNAFAGGLLDHILTTTNYAKKINEALPESMQVEYKSLLKVCFLAEIGKMDLYLENKSEWHRKNLGKMYDFNENLVSLTVGERSAYLALVNGIFLTEQEYQAILNYGKPESDDQSNWHTEILGVILKQATKLAILDEKYRYEQQ